MSQQQERIILRKKIVDKLQESPYRTDPRGKWFIIADNILEAIRPDLYKKEKK